MTPLDSPDSMSLAQRLAQRRSPQPDSLVSPGPNRAEIEQLVDIALRVPDHGRLSPWRIILIAGEAKTRWLARLFELAEQREDAPKARVTTRKMAAAPLVAVIVSTPLAGHKVPEWEQQLSAGAVCMNLLNGAHAMGYGAHWLTGWHAYDPKATALLGLGESERIAGIMLVGSVAEEAADRPRASTADVAHWLEM